MNVSKEVLLFFTELNKAKQVLVETQKATRELERASGSATSSMRTGMRSAAMDANKVLKSLAEVKTSFTSIQAAVQGGISAPFKSASESAKVFMRDMKQVDAAMSRIESMARAKSIQLPVIGGSLDLALLNTTNEGLEKQYRLRARLNALEQERAVKSGFSGMSGLAEQNMARQAMQSQLAEAEMRRANAAIGEESIRMMRQRTVERAMSSASVGAQAGGLSAMGTTRALATDQEYLSLKARLAAEAIDAVMAKLESAARAKNVRLPVIGSSLDLTLLNTTNEGLERQYRLRERLNAVSRERETPSGFSQMSVVADIQIAKNRELARTQEILNKIRSAPGSSLAAVTMFREEAAAAQRSTASLSANAQAKVAVAKATQFGVAPAAAANSGLRNTNALLNSNRFLMFNAVSGFQDAAISIQQMGNTTQGWTMAMRGASNNLGVMLATMGTTTAVVGTLALAAGPPLISWLIDLEDRTGKARKALEEYIRTSHAFAGVTKAEFGRDTSKERRDLTLQAGDELIRKGKVSPETLQKMTDLDIEGRVIPGKDIARRIKEDIVREEQKLTAAKKRRYETGSGFGTEGTPLSGPEVAERLRMSAPATSKEAREAILGSDKPGAKLTDDQKNAREELEKFRIAEAEALIEARQRAENKARDAARYIESLKGRSRTRAESELGRPLTRRKKSEQAAQKALDELEAFGKPEFATGGVVPGSGTTDSVVIKVTPGEEVLTKNDPRHISNIQGFAEGGVAFQDRLRTKRMEAAARQQDYNKRHTVGSRDSSSHREFMRDRNQAITRALEEKEASGELGYTLPSHRTYAPSATIRDPITGKVSKWQGRPEEMPNVDPNSQVLPGGGRISGPGGTIFRNPFPLPEGGGRADTQGGYVTGPGGTFGTSQPRRAQPPAGVSNFGVTDTTHPSTDPVWNRESNWPYTERQQGPQTWQQQLRSRYERREAGALGRIPSSAGMGGVPSRAGTGTYAGPSGIQGGFKRAPWEYGPGVPDVIGPGAGMPKRAGDAPGKAFHIGAGAEQGIHDESRSRDRQSAKKLEEDLQRYRDQAFQKRLEQLKEEIRLQNEMRKAQRELGLGLVNRGAQL